MKELEVKIMQHSPFNNDNYSSFSELFIYNSKYMRKMILLSLKVHFKHKSSFHLPNYTNKIVMVFYSKNAGEEMKKRITEV
jgi:hypothetical protein